MDRKTGNKTFFKKYYVNKPAESEKNSVIFSFIGDREKHSGVMIGMGQLDNYFGDAVIHTKDVSPYREVQEECISAQHSI